GIGAGAALGGTGTMAFLNDTESTSASITAGELDLKLDWKTYYNGEELDSEENPDSVQIEPTDVDGRQILKLEDVKPGDEFCISTSIHVTDNPAWVWFGGEVTSDSENGMNDPESDAEDLDTDGGELDDLMEVQTFYDDTLDCEYNGDTEEAVNKWRKVSDWMEGISNLNNCGVLLDGVRNEMIDVREDGQSEPYYPADESQTVHLSPFFPTEDGLVDAIEEWWGGTPPSGLTTGQYGTQHFVLQFRLPTDVGNEVQGDSFELSMNYYAEQARHNGFPMSPWCDELPEFSVDLVPGVDSEITGPGFTGDGDEEYYIKGVTSP
uniref:SipW-dependent-type signal peptide-containing protein n=1 Tax=Halolamina rubra TaxID=1380430 RepID=UPI001F1CAB1E